MISLLFIILLLPILTNSQTPTLQDTGICGIVSATNIQSLIPEWSCNTNGVAETSVCSWIGLTCDTNNEVNTLMLSTYSLEGTLPTSIGLLSALTSFTIENTYLYDDIPTSIGYLTNLRDLNLNSNALGPSIPSTISFMSSLSFFTAVFNQLYELPALVSNSMVNLDLYGNNLDGTIPSSLSSMGRLAYLDLSDNMFYGGFPTSLVNLNSISLIDLQINALTGSLSTVLGDFNIIDQLILCSNMFTGSVPSTIGSLHYLRDLYLYDNKFTGQFPTSIGDMSFLEYLLIYNNQFDGTIPSSMSILTNLKNIRMQSNSLTGSMPSNIGNLTLLYWLDVSKNSLTGSIPASVGKLIGLSTLELSSNELHGTIPTAIGALIQLSSLTMAQNSLSGSIPTSIGALSLCTSISLYSNRLNGTMPTVLGSLSCLYSLRLEANDMSGTIPSTILNMTQLTSIYLNSNKLTSNIPSELGSNTLLQMLDLSSNSLVGTIPLALCDLVSSLVDINVQGNPGLECYPVCLSTVIQVDSTIQEGCGTCSAGEYFVPDTYHCVPCSKGTYNKVPTDIHVVNVTSCLDCPPYTTTIGSGQTTCALFQLEADTDVIYAVLSMVMLIYLVCWFAAGHESMPVLFNMIIPMSDHITDIYYVMNEGFYSPIIFACAAFFLIAPCITLAHELICDDIQPVWLYLPFDIWRFSPWRNVSTDKYGLKLVMWIYFSIAHAMMFVFVTGWLILYWFSMLMWFIIGSFLHNSRTLAVGKVRRMWYKVWSQTDRFGDDIATVDVDVLNRLLFHGFVLETAPQVIIQMVNAILVGWGVVAKLSIAMSIIQVCFGIYKFIYWKWFRGIEFKDIPVLSSVLPDFLQLPVHTTTARPSLNTVHMSSSTVNPILTSKNEQTDKQVLVQTEATDPILIESSYEPPHNWITKCLWLKSIEGVPTYRGLTVFAIFIEHDNPLKLVYLIILWICCLFLQLCSIILSPLWIFFYDHVNLFALESHENQSNHWLLTTYIMGSTLCWIHVEFYWGCFAEATGGYVSGNDDNSPQYEEIHCGSAEHLELVGYMSLLSIGLVPLCISRILKDTLMKMMVCFFLTCMYILIYLYLLTTAFVKNHHFIDWNHEDFYLLTLIIGLFLCSLIEIWMYTYTGMCIFSMQKKIIISDECVNSSSHDTDDNDSVNNKL